MSQTCMNFAEFISAYQDGTIVNDATWRAYDIEDIASGKSSLLALKLIGFPANPAWFGEVATAYGLPNALTARMLLGFWHVMHIISTGQRYRAKLRSAENA